MAEINNAPEIEDDVEFVATLSRSLRRTSFGERRRSNLLAKDAEMRNSCVSKLDPSAPKIQSLQLIVETAIRLSLKNIVRETEEEDAELVNEFEKQVLGSIERINTALLQNPEINQVLLQAEDKGETFLQKRTKILQDETAQWKAEYKNRRKQYTEARSKVKAALRSEFVVDDLQATKLSAEDVKFLKEKPNYSAVLEKARNFEQGLAMLVEKFCKEAAIAKEAAVTAEHQITKAIEQLDVNK